MSSSSIAWQEAIVSARKEPPGPGARSRFTLELILEGRGIGKLFAIFARRSARVQIPIDQARLKSILEATT